MKPVFIRSFLLSGLIILSAGLFPFIVSAAGQWERALNSGGQSLTEDQYWNLVESSRQVVAGLKAASPDEIKNGLKNLTTQWQAFDAVTLADGRIEPVDNSYLLSALTAGKPDLNQVESIFSNLETAHKTFPSHIFTTASLGLLKQILARPEFAGLNQPTNPLSEWLHNLQARLMKWFNDLLQRLFGNSSINLHSADWSPLSILSVVILVLILFLATRSIYADFISEGSLDESGNDADKALTSDSAFDKAQALSRDGDFRSAVRYLYLSCLLLLDERGLLRYDRSKTNREVLRSVSDAPELARPLQDVIEVFDSVWYGYHSLDEDSFRHYSRRVEELKEKKK
jgi:hypothetical protein